MLVNILFYVPLWHITNRVIFNGLYYFCESLFAYEDAQIERISSRIVSSYHGISTLGMMVNAVYANVHIFSVYDPQLFTATYDTIIPYSVAYFVYDLLNDMGLGILTYSFLIHHCVAIFSGIYLYHINLAQLYVLSLFVELSSINLNIKDIMDTLDKKDNCVYLVNGSIFSVLFFISRILYAPVCIRSVYTLTLQRSEVFKETYNYAPIILVGMFTALNFFWFNQIIRIVIYKYKQL